MLLILGIALLFLAIVLSLVGYIWLLVITFKDSAGWGIATLLTGGLAGLIYALMNFGRCKAAFFISITAILSYILSFVLMVVGAVNIANDPNMQKAMQDALKDNPKALEDLKKLQEMTKKKS